jgi:pyruvate kinase
MRQDGYCLAELSSQVDALRHSVAAEARTMLQVDPSSGLRGQRLNSARHRAVRHRDIRGLQRSHMRYGLSSLGRLESRILPALEASAAALEHMVDTGPAARRHRATQFSGMLTPVSLALCAGSSIGYLEYQLSGLIGQFWEGRPKPSPS